MCFRKGAWLPWKVPSKVLNQEILWLNICEMNRHSIQPAPAHLLGLPCAKIDRKRDNGGRSRPQFLLQGPLYVSCECKFLTTMKDVQQMERQEPSCLHSLYKLVVRRWRLRVPQYILYCRECGMSQDGHREEGGGA